jgi:hypothetical protein
VYVCQSGNSTSDTFFVEEAKTQAPRREIGIKNDNLELNDGHYY